MFTENHELPEDWLKAYEDDYELDFDIPFAKTGKTYGETFKTLREYAEFKSDPLRARTSQLKKIKKHTKPADKEYILYRGLGPSTPHQVIEMLESAKINDVIIANLPK